MEDRLAQEDKNTRHRNTNTSVEIFIYRKFLVRTTKLINTYQNIKKRTVETALVQNLLAYDIRSKYRLAISVLS